jgi:hypothetical protein
MTSSTLPKILIVGAAIAAISVTACKKTEEDNSAAANTAEANANAAEATTNTATNAASAAEANANAVTATSNAAEANANSVAPH